MKSEFSFFLKLNIILIIVMAIFMQGATADVDWLPIGMWIAIIFCLALFGWGRGYLHGPQFAGIEPWLLIWIALVVISGMVSPHRWASIFSLEHVLSYAVFFYLVLWLFDDQSWERILLGSLFAIPVLAALLGTGSNLLDIPLPFPFPDNSGRVKGAFISPNNFAALLNLCTFLGFGLVIALRKKKIEILTETFSRGALLSIPIIILLASLGLTLSRGGWSGFSLAGLGLVLWLGLSSKSKRFKLSIFAVPAIVVLGIFFALYLNRLGVMGRFQQLWKYFGESPEEISLDSRAQVWRSSLKMFQDHPWFGVGPGAFGIEYPAYRMPTVMYGVKHAYNDFLDSLAEGGLACTASLAALLLAGFWVWIKRYRDEMDQFERNVSIGIAFGLLALFLHDMVDFHFKVPGIVYYFLGLAAFMLRPRVAHVEFKPIKGLGIISLFLGLPIILAIAGIQWASIVQFRRGLNYFESQEWAISSELFQSSTSILAMNPEPHQWMARTYLLMQEDREPGLRNDLLEKSEKEALAAVNLEPRYPFYWSMLGRVSELMEDAGKKPDKPPLLCYQEALSLDESNPVFQQLLAEYLLKSGKKDEAKNIIAQMIQTNAGNAVNIEKEWIDRGYDPGDLTSLVQNNAWGLVILEQALGSNPEFQAQALSCAKRAFDLEPQNQKVGGAYGQVLSTARACDQIKPLLDSSRYAGPARPIYAACLANNNRLEEAVNAYLELIQTKSEEPEYHLALAHLYLRRNLIEEAKDQFLWIASRHDRAADSIVTESFLQLGKIFEKQNQSEAALKYYRLYLENRPDDKAVVSAMEKLRNAAPVEMIHSPWEMQEKLK
jgi:O-antigen ligase/tetratricopeptide (TPR) repeat protein